MVMEEGPASDKGEEWMGLHLVLTAVVRKCSAGSFQMAPPFPLSKFLKSLKVNLSSMCDMNNEMLLNVNVS